MKMTYKSGISRLCLCTLSLFLICVMLFSFCSCGLHVFAAELSEGFNGRKIEGAAVTEAGKEAVLSFYAMLLTATACAEKENYLLSPLSVLTALAMTEAGARERTLAQMEALFGMNRDELNLFLYACLQSQNGEQLKAANSVWFYEGQLAVSDAFLQSNADYYGASVFAAPFDDTTVADINSWAKYHTDGMIEKLLDRLPRNTVMCLLNVLAFDAKWEERYENKNILDGTFYAATGEHNVSMMHSTEHLYLSDRSAQGFLKYYEGKRYAFVGILPNEGVSLDEYMASLDGAALARLLSGAKEKTVYAALPQFSYADEQNLNNPLISLGLTDAFDENKADLSGIGSAGGNLYISDVLHKTFIDVSPAGTRAAALTGVLIDRKTAEAPDENAVKIILNRPFFYMILDMENGLPVFFGAVRSCQ